MAYRKNLKKHLISNTAALWRRNIPHRFTPLRSEKVNDPCNISRNLEKSERFPRPKSRKFFEFWRDGKYDAGVFSSANYDAKATPQEFCSAWAPQNSNDCGVCETKVRFENGVRPDLFGRPKAGYMSGPHPQSNAHCTTIRAASL